VLTHGVTRQSVFMRQRILIVEDDPGIARLLLDNLTIDGFDVRCVATAHEALVACQEFLPALVVLDIMLPDRSGLEVFGRLRQGGRRGVVILSARGQKADKLRGLTLGADDYVTKPFEIEELVARIRAVLRRTTASAEAIQIGKLRIDFGNRRAVGPDGEVHLTAREFDILRYLVEHQRRVVHRDQLLRDVWGSEDATPRSVDIAIARLRKKIEDAPHAPKFIRKVHGDGYCLTVG